MAISANHILATGQTAGCQQFTNQQALLGPGFSSLAELPALHLFGKGEARWHSPILELQVLGSKARQNRLNIIISRKMVTAHTGVIVIKWWINQSKVLYPLSHTHVSAGRNNHKT